MKGDKYGKGNHNCQPEGWLCKDNNNIKLSICINKAWKEGTCN